MSSDGTGLTTTPAIPAERNLIIGNGKAFGKSIWQREMIETIIHDINNTLAPQTDEVVMWRKISVKSRSIVPHVYFLNESSFLQRA